MSSKPVALAIAGFSGRIGVRHTHVLDHRHTELVALIDPGPAAAEVAAKMAPSVPFFKSMSDMLSTTGDKKPQAAIICAPNKLHVKVAKEFVADGIDILVEKPLTDSIEDGISLLDEVVKKGVKLLVGRHKRFNRCSMATKKTPESDVLGDITAVSALWMGDKPDSYYEVPWRKASPKEVVWY